MRREANLPLTIRGEELRSNIRFAKFASQLAPLYLTRETEQTLPGQHRTIYNKGDQHPSE